MYRMHMVYLPAKLIDVAIELHFDLLIGEGITDVLESIIRKYVQAVQGHEYMTKYSGKANDPFVASSEWLHSNYLLLREMTRHGKTASDLEALKAWAIPTGPWEADDRGMQPLGATSGRDSEERALIKACWGLGWWCLSSGTHMATCNWG
ncbi:uncharacterized protein BDW43DRAFT_306858 [Aspergillus alliaceus]|uniref:uncharacterized protein n=1 Tax=Petromyces alliaceus TaxID=209559 RepID=UPI0012A71E64|nr:uncharacterized protein BDW43DRAFT_306858 [Aspergillus alliaceus]KAB8238168.1 hypothetical protein BDW43DRAFT_306858 [Aspergillus alliaceus]